MAMSKSPLISPVSWKIEFGVGVTVTASPWAANRPVSWATNSGQLKPPGKTMTESGVTRR